MKRKDWFIQNRVRARVRNAVRAGKLTKCPCEICGAMEVEAHHDDYSKPLVVRWLCRVHHNEMHLKYKATGGEG